MSTGLDGEWTSTALGEDFFMAEGGQGEDRLIMSKFNIVFLLYYIFHSALYSKHCIELLDRSFLTVGEMPLFGLK